jgi:glycosyltransferase involved in cell wall biosynthesis
VLDDVSPASEDERTYDVQLDRLARRTRAVSLRSATLVVVTSGRLREEVLAEGVAAPKVVIIPNGVPRSALQRRAGCAQLRRALGFTPDDTVLVYVGSFQAFHRLDLLVEALAGPDVPAGVRILAVGDGEDRQAVEDLATRLGVRERMVFTGRVQSGDVATYAQAADMAVLPATAEYMNPMKLYDYLAAGRAVIAPRQRAVLEVVGGSGGRLFEPGSAPALRAAIIELTLDRKRRESLASGALVAARGHTWHSRAAALLTALAARTGSDVSASWEAGRTSTARSSDVPALRTCCSRRPITCTPVNADKDVWSPVSPQPISTSAAPAGRPGLTPGAAAHLRVAYFSGSTRSPP